MAKNKQVRYTKRCEAGHCLAIDYEAWQKIKGKPKKDFVVPRVQGTGSFIPDEYNECDHCLKIKYNLSITHDALDHLGMVDLVNAEDALKAIRIAEGQIK